MRICSFMQCRVQCRQLFFCVFCFLVYRSKHHTSHFKICKRQSHRRRNEVVKGQCSYFLLRAVVFAPSNSNKERGGGRNYIYKARFPCNGRREIKFVGYQMEACGRKRINGKKKVGGMGRRYGRQTRLLSELLSYSEKKKNENWDMQARAVYAVG